MAVSYPRKGTVRTEPRDMVRVQLRDNDIRSYERSEVEGLKAQYPGAFIVGEQEADQAPAETKAQRAAPNKARQTKDAQPPEKPVAPAETKSE